VDKKIKIFLQLFIIGIINVNVQIAFIANIGIFLAYIDFIKYNPPFSFMAIIRPCIYIVAYFCLVLVNIYIQKKSKGIAYIIRFLFLLSGMIAGTLLFYVTKGIILYDFMLFYMFQRSDSISYFLCITIVITIVFLLIYKVVEKYKERI